MGFRSFLVKRIVIAILVLYIVASMNFVIFQIVSPIDPVSIIIDPDFTEEMKNLLRKQYGLDQPLHIRYIRYMQNMLTWNFGFSFDTLSPIVDDLSWRLPNTILLLGTALVGVIIVGIPLGILAASRRGSKMDVMAIGSGLLTWGVPTFFIQLIFMLIFCYYFFLWFGIQIPVRGMASDVPPTNPILYVADVAYHLALPVLSLVIAGFGSWALYTRNMLMDALTQDYIVTARAKGLSERTVLYKHAFRSTLPPVVTMVTLSVPGIVTGAMITEWIFTLPGIGRWYLLSLQHGDYPVIQAVLFIYAFLMILANLLADLLYGIFGPTYTRRHEKIGGRNHVYINQ